MGQYHVTVNLDKKQYLNPHKLGDGLKLLEQVGWSPGGINDALHLLLACSSGRGGGDFQSDSEWVGTWAGDRIAVIGDYAEADDLDGENAAAIYLQCDEAGTYQDITDHLIAILEREYECVYVGDGWRERVQLADIEGFEGSDGIGDRNIRIAGQAYAASAVRTALHSYCETHRYCPGGEEKLTVEKLGLNRPSGRAVRRASRN